MKRIGNVGVVLLVVLAGCAAGHRLTRDEALEQHPDLGTLEAALDQARAAGVPDLAPDGFREAREQAETAMDAAMRDRPEATATAVQAGLARLDRARADAAKARDVLTDVLAPRDRARAAGAADLYASEMVSADARLREVARLVEQGRLEEAKSRRAPLIENYRRLELDALKKGTEQAAGAAIARAREAGAERLAPKTLGTAREELGVALSVLDANREDTARADAHARRAAWLAERAAQIAEVVRDFDRLDYTMEDVVLWYQDHLDTVAAPLGGAVPFDRPDREVVQSLRDRVRTVVARADELEAGLARKQGELAAAADEQRRAEAEEREARERFDRVQALFAPEEADVFRQRQNVLIAAHGFWFPSGGSEIDAVNFGLLNKIVRAVREFPGAKVEVMGHTDAAGDADLNLALSQARAEKVARFLVDVGGIERARVHPQGFGETRPVASNDTMEGRAANRRVEILIVNE
jgi:OOP family OmpA-OmpF porin